VRFTTLINKYSNKRAPERERERERERETERDGEKVCDVRVAYTLPTKFWTRLMTLRVKIQA
jgi:uncharacterized protein YkuJ